MITITAAEIDAQVSAWIAANQTGKRRPGIARIAKALGYARLSVKSSVERIERAAAKAAEPTTHRAYCRNSTIECSCTEYGRDHVARLETYDNPAPALAALEAATAEPVAKTAAEGRCDGGKWCRCRDANGDLIAYADALKPHNRTDARREVGPPTHTDALMVTWDTSTKHRGDGIRTACGRVGRLAQFADGYKATCTTGGCLEAWAN